MLSAETPSSAPDLRDEQGFTLIEVLVALVIGVIVTGALFAILEISLHQTSRINDRAQAQQLGRGTMTRMVEELRSACLSPSFRPVKAGSSETELVFINADSKQAEIGSKSLSGEVFEHKLKWDKTNETLTDYIYPASGGSWPEFTFATTASPAKGVRIGEHITATEGSGIFQFYKYESKSASTGSTGLSTLVSLGLPEKTVLNEEQAKTVGSVLINFTAGPSSGNTKLNRTVPVNSQITFSFSVPDAETPIEASPCE